jgi:4-amino-4-deoxy-L-arabinose transferase-like glycosyltransferase
MKSAVFAWAGVLIVAATLLAASAYRSRDPDSTVYAEISGRLSALPLRAWLAPEWGGSWGFSGPFREHPIGIFVLPALLGRLGYPAEQAAFAVGALFSVASLWMARWVVAPLVRDDEATAAQWAALILPIAFVYRIRANQEYPVLFLTLLAIAATHRARRSPVWVLALIGAACALALIKGIFVIFIPVICSLWLLLIQDEQGTSLDSQRPHLRDVAAWTGVAAAVLAVIVTAYAYEWMYRRVTGESFLTFYLHDRIAANAGLATTAARFNPATKLYNVLWYVARLLWFAMPGSLVLLLSMGRLRRLSARDVRRVSFVLLAAAVYVGAMSLGANKADRFIFPAYFLVGIAGAIVAMRRWTTVDQWARRLAALPSYALPLAWLALFILTFATEGHLPYLKFWRS